MPLTKRLRSRAELHARKMMEALSLPLSGDMEETPKRVVRMLEEMTASIRDTSLPFRFTTFGSSYDQLIVAKKIQFASMCSHHLLPFYGYVHIGYLPDGKVCGWSKLSRLVRYLAARPQMQEEFTERICDQLQSILSPKAVIVVVKAAHTCSRVRGVRDPESEMITSALRPVTDTAFGIRSEFFSLLGLSND